VLAGLLATGAGLRWQRALATAFDAGAQVTMIPPPAAIARFSPDSLDNAAHLTVVNDPFRLANAPASVSFASTLVPSSGPAAPVPPKVRPKFIVRAIIGGPPWSAILDGVPGQPAGLVVSPGAAYDQILVQAIGRDTVVVVGPDTTWHLTMGGS
jgi:hypothetical protein